MALQLDCCNLPAICVINRSYNMQYNNKFREEVIEMTEEEIALNETLIAFTSDIVAAHVSNNSVAVSDLPLIISSVHGALAALSSKAAEQARPDPAVPIKASIKPDYVVCLEDGKKLKMLKRHLMTHYGMTPEDYRAKWGLPNDYPMVAPNYAEKRRQLAKAIGLGKKKGKKT